MCIYCKMISMIKLVSHFPPHIITTFLLLLLLWWEVLRSTLHYSWQLATNFIWAWVLIRRALWLGIGTWLSNRKPNSSDLNKWDSPMRSLKAVDCWHCQHSKMSEPDSAILWALTLCISPQSCKIAAAASDIKPSRKGKTQVEQKAMSAASVYFYQENTCFPRKLSQIPPLFHWPQLQHSSNCKRGFVSTESGECSYPS